MVCQGGAGSTKKTYIFVQSIDIDPILDKDKRECIYAKYDQKYESNAEEDEIFREMAKRRKRYKK